MRRVRATCARGIACETLRCAELSPLAADPHGLAVFLVHHGRMRRSSPVVLALLALVACGPSASGQPHAVDTQPSAVTQPASTADDRAARLHAQLAAAGLPEPYEPGYEDLADSTCGALGRGARFSQLTTAAQPPFTPADLGLVVRAAVFAYCPQYSASLPV